MPNINDLVIKIQAIKTELLNELPKHIAADMHTQTMHNFDTEAYTNNATPQKWPDRPREAELNYKKLDYTGNLKRSIKPMSSKTAKSSIAKLKTGVRYAKVHNEGTKKLIKTGNPYRNPPYAAEKLFTGYARKKRQFMGIGTKTITQAKKRINEILKKYL